MNTDLAKNVVAMKSEYKFRLETSFTVKPIFFNLVFEILLIFYIFFLYFRNKLELQLQAIIQKYDSTIGEKKIELFELEKKVNEAKEKVDKCWIIYHKEKKIFESLIGDREREEQRLRKVMIVKFSMNWAASKIQRYWRKWRKRLLRKRSKQKNVKRKSKKPNK